jgi:pimeloyl-ACP methyl ester carboxylesterase
MSLPFGRTELSRRILLAGLGGTACAFGANALAVAAQGLSTESFEALAAFGGVYRRPDGAAFGVNRFLNDAGRPVLLFADYATSLVRPLSGGPDTFTLGPTFDAASPVEAIIRFEMNGEAAAGLIVRPSQGPEVVAAKEAGNDEDISFGHDEASLSGTLMRPAGPGPHPAVVLLHGSGPLTRHSFGPYPRFFNSLGMAVLTFDKRGTGASTGRRLDASTGNPATLWPAFYPDDLAADARAAFAFLRSQPGIDHAHVGFWGSSEGGMLGTQVAGQSRDVAFAINSSGFMGPLWRTILYQGAAMLRAAGTPEPEIERATAFNRFWMQVARTGLGYDEFLKRRAEIQSSGKKGWFYYVNADFSSLAQMRWAWRHILAFDSLPALRQVRCPVLGLFGRADVLTDATTASRSMQQALLAAGNRRVSVQIVPNASHSLMETPGRRGMAPGVFASLEGWLRSHGLSTA